MRSNEAVWVSFCLGLALKSSAVFVVAWTACVLLRKGSASARHLVWTAAASAVLILPILSVLLPSMGVTVPVVLLPGATAVASPWSAEARGISSAAPSSVSGGMDASRRAGRSPNGKIWLTIVWAAGSFAGFAQLLFGYITMFRVRRRAHAFADRELVFDASQALGIRRKIAVLETTAGRMPMAFGIVRPVVLIPEDAAGWTDERRKVVLLHEMAHVIRQDVATHWLARVALIAYWWNPLAWKMWREFLAEGERAADDMVLGAGTRPSDYASHLLEVARSMRRANGLGVAMARPSQLEGRLVAILDSGKNRHPVGLAWGLAAGALAVALVAPLAAVQAQDGSSPALPIDVDGAIRAATSQKNPAILEDAAGAAEQLRKFDTAQRLLEAALAIHGGISGPQSKEYGAGLLKLGEIEARQNKSPEDLYARAAQILADRPEAAPALIHLGAAALGKKDYAEAFDDFQHAQRIDPAHAGIATMWMAVARAREKNPEYHGGSNDVRDEDADRLFQSAVAMQGPKSSEAITIMRVYAQFLRKQNRPEDAAAMDARAGATLKTNARPKPALSPGTYGIGGNVKAPSVQSKVEPRYSEEARLAQLEGKVTIQVEIGADGMAHNPQVSQPLGLGLEDTAIDAVRQWHFNPGIRDGQPVAVAATIEVNFRLL